MSNSTSQVNPVEPALGLEAFDSLRAEDEPWLIQCFVSPPNIEQIASERSVIVFGGSGSGKSAISQYLEYLCLNPDGSPNRLVAKWAPSPLDKRLSGIAAVRAQAEQVLDACVEAVLQFLAHHPVYLETAPATSREALAWFIQQHSKSDFTVRIEQMIEEEKPPGEAILETIKTASPRKILPPDASPDKVAARLIRTLNTLGLKGVWIIGDEAELDMWADVDPDDLVSRLSGFFSTLPLFEQANFSYKLLLPAWLEQKTLAVVQTIRQRQRIFPYYLRQWDTTSLQEIINRRLKLTFGQADFTLNQLCNAEDFLQWLEWVGDTSPREWLEQVRPLVEHYLATRTNQPINQETWHELRLQNPPRLYLDDEGKRIMVGARQISLTELPVKAYEILRYLYQQPSGYVTTRAELYYRCYKALDYIPQPLDKYYEGPEEYRGMIDTALYRIREAIEPDPSRRDHVLLLTVRGHGVKLNTRW